MVGLLLLVLLAVPIAELFVIVRVAGGIGIGNTLLLLVAVSVIGVWLAKYVGLGVLRRMQDVVARGRVPSRELVDGALVLLAGVLLVAPGFLSDVVAVLLLLPPTRALARTAVLRRIRARGAVFSTGRAIFVRPGRSGRAEVWDVDGWEEPGRDDHPELGP